MAEAGGGRRRTVRTYARLLLGCCAAAWRGCETLCPRPRPCPCPYSGQDHHIDARTGSLIALHAVRRRSPRPMGIPAASQPRPSSSPLALRYLETRPRVRLPACVIPSQCPTRPPLLSIQSCKARCAVRPPHPSVQSVRLSLSIRVQ